jgi:hypothetical protein
MTLKVSAHASVLDVAAGDRLVTDVARLAALDRISSDECFSDYLLDNSDTKELPSKGVSGGYLRFRLRSDLKQLWVETEYDLRERLSDKDMESLVDFTLGQWSDGIGENFCPAFAERTGLFLSIHVKDATSEITA